jgi:hypothetical protein
VTRDALHEVRDWVAAIGHVNLETGRRIVDVLAVIDRAIAAVPTSRAAPGDAPPGVILDNPGLRREPER